MAESKQKEERNKREPRVPDKEDISKLVRWAKVAYAARCARLVQHLFDEVVSELEDFKRHQKAVEEAITLAEQSATDAVTAARTADAATAAKAAGAAGTASIAARVSGAVNTAFQATRAKEASTAKDASIAYDALTAKANYIYAAYAAAYAARTAEVATAKYVNAAYAAATYAVDAAYAAGDATEGSIVSRLWEDYKKLHEFQEQAKWSDKTPIPPSVFAQVYYTSAGREAPAEVDLLDREPLVHAISQMIIDDGREKQRLTIGLLGPWGSGKSSIFAQLKALLNKDHKERVLFAEFNAWKHQKVENQSAALAYEVFNGIKSSIKYRERVFLPIRFGLQLNGKDILNNFILLAFSSILIGLLWKTGSLTDGSINANDVVASIAGLLGASTFAYFIIGFSKSIGNILQNPITGRIGSYLQLPKYGEHLGLITELRKHMEVLCSLFTGKKKNRRLVVFVDDIDRCSQQQMLATLETIQLMMDIDNVIIVLAVDTEITMQALCNSKEHGIQSMRDAREYLGKIIQIPIRLPSMEDASLETFLRGNMPIERPISSETDVSETELLAEDESEAVKAENDESGDQGTVKSVTPKTSPELVESPTRRAVLLNADEAKKFENLAKKYNFRNPRQLLRLINSIQFMKVLLHQSGGKMMDEINRLCELENFHQSNLSVGDEAPDLGESESRWADLLVLRQPIPKPKPTSS